MAELHQDKHLREDYLAYENHRTVRRVGHRYSGVGCVGDDGCEIASGYVVFDRRSPGGLQKEEDVSQAEAALLGRWPL